ncbi:hypothetical protein OH687_04790 [Burkholderia anthina]|nr:hypothetical protein OH687_04790 [Burkholderia anthina]
MAPIVATGGRWELASGQACVEALVRIVATGPLELRRRQAKVSRSQAEGHRHDR